MRVFLVSTMLLAFFAIPASSQAATSEYSMTLGVGEEYNSNVNERVDAEADWVSKATAVGKAKYESSRMEFSGSIDGSFNVYALGKRTDEFKGTARLSSKATVVPELFFVEAQGNFSQVYSNLIRGETNTTDSTRTQVDQYSVSGTAYFTPHFSDRFSCMIGYQFIGYIYGDGSNGSVSDNSASSNTTKNKVSNGVFANLKYEMTPVFQLMLDANALRQDSRSGGLQRVYATAGFKWQYSEDGYISAKAGPQYSSYDNGATSLNPYIDAVWSHTIRHFTASASLSSQYKENPIAAYSSLQKAAGVTLGWQGDRLSLRASASYTNTDGEDTRDSDQIAVGVSATYAITERLRLSAGATRNSTLTSSYTQVRWYANGSLTYDLGKDFSLEGYYRWKVYDTTQNTNGNYSVNIVGLTLKKTF